MGIDLILLDDAGNEVRHGRFASIGGFYNLAHLLGYLMPAMRELLPYDKDGMMKRAVDWFDHYVAAERIEADEAFSGYCEFTTHTREHLLAEHPPADPHDLDHMMANAADFDPDVRVMLGRLVFSEHPIGPEFTSEFSWFGRGMLGVMQGVGHHYQEKGEESVVAAIAEAQGCLRTLVEFCEDAAENNRLLVFDA